MKIAIPTDENRTDICVSFARAPFFCLYDTEQATRTMVDNPAAAAHGGAGVQAAQFIVDSGADTLITVRCGENAAEVLNEVKMTIYRAEGTDVEGNLTACIEGKLSVLDHFHKGFHGIQ